VEVVDFMDALEKIALGPARQIVMSQDERERVAFHEGGHAILGLVVPGVDPVNRVTIMPRGQALGVTYQRAEEDRHNYSEPYLRARIIGALGGRAAEELVYGSRTGSEQDLQQAPELACQMVTRGGMSDKLGPISLSPRGGGFLGESEPVSFPGAAKPYSEASAQLIDAEVQAILDGCYQQGLAQLSRHRAELDRLAAALLEHETLDEQHILEVTGFGRAPRLATAPLQEQLAAFSAKPAG
jgi:cell division protease FtsH